MQTFAVWLSMLLVFMLLMMYVCVYSEDLLDDDSTQRLICSGKHGSRSYGTASVSSNSRCHSTKVQQVVYHMQTVCCCRMSVFCALVRWLDILPEHDVCLLCFGKVARHIARTWCLSSVLWWLDILREHDVCLLCFGKVARHIARTWCLGGQNMVTASF